MEKYYWETTRNHGKSDMTSDAQAIEAWKGIPGLLAIYKQNEDGTDLIIIWEKENKKASVA